MYKSKTLNYFCSHSNWYLSRKFEGLERYIEQLELYLVHFSSSVQEAVADDDIDD